VTDPVRSPGGAPAGRGVVVDADGVGGSFVEIADDLSPDEIRAAINFGNGRRVLVPRSLLLPQDDGTFRVPLSLATLAGEPTDGPAGGEQVIPLAEEQVRVGKRRRETAKLRVTTRIEQKEEVVDLPLMKERVEVHHVPIERWIEAPAGIRQEGDTTILPVMEEVLVVEKRLRLVEEVHLVKHRDVVRHREAVTLRRETAEIERKSLSGGEAGEGELPRR